MTYSQWPPNLYASPHHCADTSDIFGIYGSSIGDPDLFNNELYYLSPLSTLSSHSFDASFGLYSALPSCTERITDLEIPPPHTNGTADEGRAESSPTIGHKDPIENKNDTCYRYYTSNVSCANDSPDAYNTTVSASFPSLIMGSAPVSEGPRISPECPAIMPNVTSQLDTTATPCTRNTLLPRALNSSITSNEITACDNTSSESIREELSACCIDTIRPQICPPGYRKRSFPSEMAEKLIRDYNIPAHHVYYYWRDQDRDDHTCPLNCGQRFIGESIRAHLETFHPNINSRSRKYICCRTPSHSKSKCPPKNIVQERYFLKHFTVMHSLAHSLCPFCLGRQTRVDHLYRHFAVCKVLRPKN